MTTPSTSSSSASDALRVLRSGWRRRRAGIGRVADQLVSCGLPPWWIGYRRVRKTPFETYLRQHSISSDIIHAPSVVRNPMPRNIETREALPDDAGWWGFSFRDVPERKSGATVRATVPNALVVPSADARGQFWASILDRRGTSVELREISFRPWQASTIRNKPRRRIERATWFLERVFHNHSHWLTAHLPKLLLMRERGELEQTLWPEELPRGIADSLEFYGIPAAQLPKFAPDELLQVDELTLYATDRFRPELLRRVRDECPGPAPDRRDRRIYISRARATRRRLLNEDDIWPKFEKAGFERVLMEDLPFREQVRTMREAAMVAAPHGAGLTNMIFCGPGTNVIELADLGFPNPNFYALASAMDLRYWLVPVEGVGAGHPLNRDMIADPVAIDQLLDQVAET